MRFVPLEGAIPQAFIASDSCAGHVPNACSPSRTCTSSVVIRLVCVATAGGVQGVQDEVVSVRTREHHLGLQRPLQAVAFMWSSR